MEADSQSHLFNFKLSQVVHQVTTTYTSALQFAFWFIQVSTHTSISPSPSPLLRFHFLLLCILLFKSLQASKIYFISQVTCAIPAFKYDIDTLVGQQMTTSNSTNPPMPAPIQDALSSGSNQTDTPSTFVDDTSDAGRFTVASISFAYFINILLLLLSQVSFYPLIRT